MLPDLMNRARAVLAARQPGALMWFGVRWLENWKELVFLIPTISACHDILYALFLAGDLLLPHDFAAGIYRLFWHGEPSCLSPSLLFY